MTNGEKIQKDFKGCEVCEPIVEDDIIHVIFADKKDSAIGFYWSWWNAEYQEPSSSEIPKNSPTETLVSLNVYKQVAKERDIAIQQLHELGYEFGQKIEPTTENCESCKYYGSHHEVCNYCYKCSLWTEKKPTTKNDLGVDREQLKTMIRGLTKWYVKRDNTGVGEPNTAVGLLYDDVMFGIDRLPPATPQEPRWIPVSERLPDTDDEFLCWYEYYHWSQGKVLPEYGLGRYLRVTSSWSGEVASGRDVRVIAWMPLPKPYSEVEE